MGKVAFEEASVHFEGRAEQAMRTLEAGYEDATAVLVLPQKYRWRLRTANMVEHYIEEICRRERVVRIFPNERSARRVIGALAAEQHEAWATGRLYLNMDAFYAWKASFEAEETAALAA